MNHIDEVLSSMHVLDKNYGRANMIADIARRCSTISTNFVVYDNILKGRIHDGYVGVPNEYDYRQQTTYYRAYKSIENEMSALIEDGITSVEYANMVLSRFRSVIETHVVNGVMYYVLVTPYGAFVV